MENKSEKIRNEYFGLTQYSNPLTTTSKLQLNYRRAIVGFWNLDEQKSCNKGYKEEATLSLVGGVETHPDWLHAHAWG